jgi:hypothetical protein
MSYKYLVKNFYFMDFLKVSYKDMILNKVMTYSHTKKVYKNIKDLRLYLESAVHTFNHLKNNRHFIIKQKVFVTIWRYLIILNWYIYECERHM